MDLSSGVSVLQGFFIVKNLLFYDITCEKRFSTIHLKPIIHVFDHDYCLLLTGTLIEFSYRILVLDSCFSIDIL